MGRDDIAATVLASLALFVSIATLYLTFFRKKAGLVGCLTAITAPEPADLGTCVFEFALSNTGTLELLVRDISLVLDGPDEGLVPEIRPSVLPAVLKPGQVQLLKLEIPNLFMRKSAMSGRGVSVQFHVVSSRGIFYRPRKMLAPQGDTHDLPSDVWAPFVLGAAE